MENTAPASANAFVLSQLRERILAVGQAFDADALTIYGDLLDGVDDLIRTVVEAMRQQDSTHRRLAVILTTTGGYLEPVRRIVATFRHHYDHVSFIVPNYAFSAGTVLVMSGDDIYMDYFSRLGPIDPQVPTARGELVPALGYLKRWEALIEKANDGTISPAEIVVMVEHFNQAQLYEFQEAQKLSVDLLQDWLTRYKFKDWTETETHHIPVTDEMRVTRAREIGEMLNETDKWHSHGHGISMEVLRRDVNLKIDDLDDPQCQGKRFAVKAYYSLLADYMATVRHKAAIHYPLDYLPYS